MTEIEITKANDITNFDYTIFKEKYAMRDEDGNSIEHSPAQMFKRVSRTLADGFFKGKTNEGFSCTRQELENMFYNCMAERRGILAGRPLLAIGNPANITAMNCFVVPIEDSIDGIYENQRLAAKIQQSGGGFGTNFSTLRPKGALVKGVRSTASGPISFMKSWDAMIETMKSAGNRRGAGIAILDANHPDVSEFVTCKKNKDLTNFNISIGITDDFVEALKANREYELEHDGAVYGKVKASDVFEKIAENMYNFNEPGFFFKDRTNQYSNSYYYQEITSTNPCLVGDTLVTTKSGDIKIEELVKKYELGEEFEALTLNIETLEFEWEKVTNALLTKTNTNIIKIEFDDSSFIELTPDHEVYTENRGYIKASLLNNDDVIISY